MAPVCRPNPLSYTYSYSLSLSLECSLGFPDGAGQPYGLTMLRVFEELGFDTGDPCKESMNKLSDFCKEMRPLYPQANVARTPDISVEASGIAGGTEEHTGQGTARFEPGAPHSTD